jgi:hypothetical protein
MEAFMRRRIPVLMFGRYFTVWMMIALVLSQPVYSQTPPPFSGVDVFRGVFFGDGPVRSRLPELWNNPLFFRGTTLTQAQVAAELRTDQTALASAGESELAAIVGETATFLENNPGLDPTPTVGVDSTFQTDIISQINILDPTFFSRFAAEMQSVDHLRVRASLIEGGALYLEAWKNVTGLGLGGSDPRLAHVLALAGFIALVVAIAAVIATVAFIMDSHSVHPGADLLPFDQVVDLLTIRLDPDFVVGVPARGPLALSLVLLALIALFLFRTYRNNVMDPA